MLDHKLKLLVVASRKDQCPCKGQRRGRLAAALRDARTSERTLREAFDLYREIATEHVEHLGAADDGVSWDLVAICGGPARMTRQRFFCVPV